MIYFSSDFHVNHFNIIRYCGRPFSSVEEMNQVMLDRINSTVKKNDTFFLLGDLNVGPKELIWDWLDEIVCDNIHLILGNHDRKTYLIRENETRKVFKSISKGLYSIPLDKKVPFTLTHQRFKPEKLNPQEIYLSGHSHGKLLQYRPNAFDIGVDANDFYPVPITTILDLYALKK